MEITNLTLTPREVRGMFRVSGATLRSWVERGTLSPIKVGPRVWRYRTRDVMAILNGGD
jgi:predicted site-specific integrase-resolvase